MVDLRDIIVIALCGAALTELVFHASFLREFRIKQETGNGKLKYLIRCPYCVSHWAALLATLLVVFHIRWIYWIALWLAATRLSNIIHDLIGSRSRSPKQDLD